jgi:L-aspartate oxidase
LQGEGLAAALAGAVIADPEFVQFHPTAIDIGRDPAPLATEALRGEGALLVDAAGRVHVDYHPDAELAPRDVVARAIHAERRPVAARSWTPAPRSAGTSRTNSPRCSPPACRGGIDPRVQPIPVVRPCTTTWAASPRTSTAATSLPGLLAAGECASTGVHGANRLASNSLLEAAVFGTRAGARRRFAEAEPPLAPGHCPCPTCPRPRCRPCARP